MRIAAVGPKKDDTIEQGRNVGHDSVEHLREEAKDAAVSLEEIEMIRIGNRTKTTTTTTTYITIEVLVEIEDAGDAAAIVVRIVDVAHVAAEVARVAGDHGLGALANLVLEKFAHRQVGVAAVDDRVEYSNEEADLIAIRLGALHPHNLVAAYHRRERVRLRVQHLALAKAAAIVEVGHLAENGVAVLNEIIDHTKAIAIHVVQHNVRVGQQTSEGDVATLVADAHQIIVIMSWQGIVGRRDMLLASLGRGVDVAAAAAAAAVGVVVGHWNRNVGVIAILSM